MKLTNPLLVVTAASPAYFRSLQQLLLSLWRHRHQECLVFDLELEEWQVRWLKQKHPWVQLRKLPPGPDHLKNWANFAWKPTALASVLQDANQPILWLDSACVVTGSLEPILQHLSKAGIWVPWAGRGSLAARTHPHTLRALSVEPLVQGQRFRAGGVCAFHPEHSGVCELVVAWRALAWDHSILSPAGASSLNHRYDQALLTILLSRSTLDPGTDEIDISSSRPFAPLRTRNKVPDYWPVGLDGLTRLAFAVRRQLDVWAWRLRDLKGVS